MNETKIYRAFGLTIESEFPLAQIPQLSSGIPDVRIVRHDGLSGLAPSDGVHIDPETVLITAGEYAVMRVSKGQLIEVQPFERCDASHLAVFLMGSCMGAILVQRGFMLLHGSCVTNGRRSILITGDSGAGKSTLAAEFLKQGWMLVTDDVTCVYDQDGIPMVRSSYPSQKLWQDALDRYDKDGSDIHSLYFSDNREKFGVNVTESFYDGIAPLSMVVRLIPADRPTYVGPIEGMAKVDQLLRNTYRIYLIDKRHHQRHFQRCVTLSAKLPMALAIRENGTQCADTLYELITDHLGGIYHE